jgi:hypothetical protein
MLERKAIRAVIAGGKTPIEKTKVVAKRQKCSSASTVWFNHMLPPCARGKVIKARRAPKVTVTREGDSLCQKGCYPLALVFC